MPLSVKKGEGYTVYTVTSDPRSTSPLLCQILRLWCCSPTCLVSGNLRKLLGGTLTSLGIVQIMVGLLTIGLGALLLCLYDGPYCIYEHASAYWWGTCFIVSGIISILGDRFSSPWLVFLTAFFHMASGILAMAAIGLSIEGGALYTWTCLDHDDSDSGYSHDGFRQPRVNLTEEQQRAKHLDLQLCRMYKSSVQPISIGLKVLLMAFAVLQLCVAISVAVVAIKALIRNSKQEVTEIEQPLIEEVTANPVA